MRDGLISRAARGGGGDGGDNANKKTTFKRPRERESKDGTLLQIGSARNNLYL
jgi:hypothetical protein